MNESGKALIVVLPTGQDSSEGIEPSKQAFNLPSPFVSTQYATVLSRFSDAVVSVRCDQLNAAGSKFFIERIAVIGTILNKSFRESPSDGCIDGSSDKGDFMWASRSRVHDEWKTCSVRNCHELRTFSSLGLSRFGPPFFATTKVPSMKHSDRSI
jgi:hypothetical protein